MSTAITRREMVRGSLAGAAGLLLADGLGVRSRVVAEAAKPQGKAKSVIQIWLWGGPPHLDTFDPKPAAGNDYCGPLNRPIPTNVEGTVIGELLPLLAPQQIPYEEKLARLPGEMILPENPLKMVQPEAGSLSR